MCTSSLLKSFRDVATGITSFALASPFGNAALNISREVLNIQHGTPEFFLAATTSSLITGIGAIGICKLGQHCFKP